MLMSCLERTKNVARTIRFFARNRMIYFHLMQKIRKEKEQYAETERKADEILGDAQTAEELRTDRTEAFKGSWMFPLHSKEED